MFNSDFFPTPTDVILQMVGSENLSGKTVLEPSAGKGDIVNFLKNLGASVLTCEKNPDLAQIVASKSKFLKHDFLKVTADEISHIHAIYMNPPFSADEKHILHAWDIAPSGCHIVALCNYETIANVYSRYRKQLLRVIEGYGTSENIGSVFDSAERKTGINIGLIHLYKPKVDNDFGDYFESADDDFEQQENGIMSYNVVREVVQRYVNSVKLYDEVIENAVKMNQLAGEFGAKDLTFTCTQDGKQIAKSSFQKDLQKKAWKWIFSKMNMDKFMTASLKSDINKFVENQEKVPFTMKNIYKMFELVIGTHGQRMDKVLIEVFERLTTHYSENRYNVEGWKTNSHYLVNQKFIIPGMCEQDKWNKGSDKVDASCHIRGMELIEDFAKALCYLTGTNSESFPTLYTQISNRYKIFKNGLFVKGLNKPEDIKELQEQGRPEILIEDSKVQYGDWNEWAFFRFKCFKKGTIHFEFKDEDVWARFNQAVAKAKGFELPESLRRAA